MAHIFWVSLIRIFKLHCVSVLYTKTNCVYSEAESSGSVGRVLVWESKGCSSWLTGVTVLCSWARHFIRCLVLIQTRKMGNCPDMPEKMLFITNRNPFLPCQTEKEQYIYADFSNNRNLVQVVYLYGNTSSPGWQLRWEIMHNHQ